MNGKEAVSRAASVAASAVSRIARPRYLVCAVLAALFVAPVGAQASVPTCPDGQPCESYYRPSDQGLGAQRGLVIAVHGGGWQGPIDRVDPSQTPIQSLSQLTYQPWIEPAANSVNDYGILGVTYTGMDCSSPPLLDPDSCSASGGEDGFQSIDDVEEFVRDIQINHSGTKIVLAGASAGGQIAYSAAGQLAAAGHPVDGLILASTPLDLTQTTAGSAANAPAKVTQVVQDLAVTAFLGATPASISPMTYPRNIPTAMGACAPAFSGGPADDLVNWQQISAMYFSLEDNFPNANHFYATAMRHQSGGVNFPHCTNDEGNKGVRADDYGVYKDSLQDVLFDART